MNQLKEMLEAYRNGERGLPTYDELAAVAYKEETDMSAKETGGSAFPDFKQADMTLRDYFAAKAMQALLSKPIHRLSDAQSIPSAAYSIADAMLAECAK